MMNRWGIKSATLTFGSTSYDMASGVAGKSETKDAIDVTALTDQVKRYITGAVKEIDEFTVTLYQSSSDITVDTAPAAGTISVTLENGEEQDASVTVSFAKLIVTKVAYPSVDASGDRKATYDVTFRPNGAELSSSNA